MIFLFSERVARVDNPGVIEGTSGDLGQRRLQRLRPQSVSLVLKVTLLVHGGLRLQGVLPTLA